MFASLVGLNVAVGFSFLLSEVTCELTLRADPAGSLQRSGAYLLFALQCVFSHHLGDLCEEE